MNKNARAPHGVRLTINPFGWAFGTLGGAVAITIVDVEDVLRDRERSLTLTGLHALSPARDPYRAILLQPTGVIEANNIRVEHVDPTRGPRT